MMANPNERWPWRIPASWASRPPLWICWECILLVIFTGRAYSDESSDGQQVLLQAGHIDSSERCSSCSQNILACWSYRPMVFKRLGGEVPFSSTLALSGGCWVLVQRPERFL